MPPPSRDALNRAVEIPGVYAVVVPSAVLAALDDEQRQTLAEHLWGHYSHDEQDEAAEIAAMRRAVDGTVECADL